MRKTKQIQSYILANYQTQTAAEMAVANRVTYRCIHYNCEILNVQPLGFRNRFTKEQKEYINSTEGTLTIREICMHLYGDYNEKYYLRTLCYVTNNKIKYKRHTKERRPIPYSEHEIEMVRAAAERLKKVS
jgi:hypothetical protein